MHGGSNLVQVSTNKLWVTPTQSNTRNEAVQYRLLGMKSLFLNSLLLKAGLSLNAFWQGTS